MRGLFWKEDPPWQSPSFDIGRLQRLPRAQEAQGFSWSLDGQALVFAAQPASRRTFINIHV